tara:strand:+ start:1885 stop:2088 length:204 start_codon:yes stop_codon:yes gene_type:complete
MEKLDLKNIIEVDKIRDILRGHPDLLSMFEIIIIMCNNRLNTEAIAKNLPQEKNIEPELSDHSSDED